jgi:hypothetical protein
MARLPFSVKTWTNVKDMSLSFTTPRKWTLRFLYNIQVSPQNAPNADVLKKPDFIAMRIVIDGMPYRESSALASSASRTYSTASLAGEVILEIAAGTHKVDLQWRKWGSHVPVWWSHPHFLDGFVSGRSLLVIGEHHPIAISQPVPDATLSTMKTNGQTNQTIINGWKDIASTQISFTMPTTSKVTFSYIVSITQWGHPDWDAWTWKKFNAIGMRLVVDGLPFQESGTYSDPNVKSTEDVVGDMTMSLPAGPHIAKLQWKAVGTSVKEWRSLQNILDGFAGSRQLLAVLHPQNYAPLISTSPLQTVNEDEVVSLGIDVSDLDISKTPESHVSVTLKSKNGTISLNTDEKLSFAVGNGKQDKFVRFSGDLTSVNSALRNVSYQAHHDFHGLDNLTIVVDDQGNTGGSGYGAVDVRTVQVNVESQNDQPTFSIPAPQMVNEDTTLLINGVGIYDVDINDLGGGNAKFQVTMSVVSGRLSLLGSVEKLHFTVGDGKEDTSMTFTGSLYAINNALGRLTYLGDSDSNFEQAFEALTLHITDMGGDGKTNTKSLDDTVVIPIRVNPVNDAPQIVLPRSQTILITVRR